MKLVRTAVDVFDAAFPPTSPTMRQWRWILLAGAAFFVLELFAQGIWLLARKWRKR